MPQDLRRTVGKNQIERRKAPRSKWAQGSWHAAGAYNASLPPTRSPILVGGDSFIQTPEDLRDLLRLESVPSLIQTTQTTLFPFPDEKPDDPAKKPVYVCDVSMDDWLDIQKVTDGGMPIVWFQGKKRSAWLARSKKPGENAISTENK